MNKYECWEIGGHSLEFLDDVHQYVCDGICLPSITQCLKVRFKNKYAGIDEATLIGHQRQAQRFTKPLRNFARMAQRETTSKS
jgi:hypothetical protein